MSPLRFTAVLVAATLLASAADAQTPIERLLAAYKRPIVDPTPESENLLTKIKEGTTALTDKARAAIREKTQSIVYKVTLAEYHETVKPKEEALQPRNKEKTVDKLIVELREQFIQTPDGKLNENQKDFQRELGSAVFDAVLLIMTDRDPPPLLRVNAARLLLPAAETASPAVGRGLTKLLAGGVFKDDKKAPVATPPDVLYYALRACEAFLDKYDSSKPGPKDLSPDSLAELVGLLIGYVEKGPPILDKIAVTGTTPTADQTSARTAAIRFYRLQAVRALAKARADGYPAKADTLRPMYTLARVAARDPAILPAPSTKEVGEATLGLMAAAVGQDVNADTLAYVVALGASEFFYPRAEKKPDMKLIDWPISAQRFATAAAAWTAAVQKNPAVQPAGKKAIADVVVKLDKELFAPLLKTENVLGSDPNVSEVTLWLDGLKAGLPETLLNDSRDKTKYKMNYPKR